MAPDQISNTQPDQSIAASTLTGTVYESKKAVEDEPLIDFLSDPIPPSNSQALV